MPVRESRSSVDYSPYARLMADVGLTLAALFMADLLRHLIPLGRPIAPHTVYLTPSIYALVMVIWPISFAFFDAYGSRRRRALDELRTVISALSVALLLFAGAMNFTRTRDFSRLLVLYFATLNLILLLASRWIWNIGGLLCRSSYERRRWNTIIVGTGPTAQEVLRRLHEHPHDPFKLIGFVALSHHDAATIAQVPLLGFLEDIRTIVTRTRAHCVILALPIAYAGRTAETLLELQSLSARIFVVPDYVGIVPLASRIEDFYGVPMIAVADFRLSPFTRLLKRLLDFCFAVVALAVTWPLFLVIAVAIRLDSPGPIFFLQERVGERGRHFKMWKFRSMVTNAEEQLPSLLASRPSDTPPLKIKDDPRVTRVGRLLRRASLDELPQLINVLKGDMSVVGPRPEEPRIVRTYNAWQRKRLLVKPGITGPMQVSGRADLPLDDRVRLELDYIHNYSLLEDIRLLLKTIPVIISGKGCY